MSKRRILITGGTGFIGGEVVSELVGSDFEVHVVSSRGGSEEVAGTTLHRADLLDASDRRAVLDRVRPSHLVHLAWFVQPGQVWNSLENVRWVEASLALLREFHAVGGRRVLMAGTCSEYGAASGVLSENLTAASGSNLYGVSKNAVRAVALATAKELGLSLAWARIFFAYGPRENPARLLASVIGHLLQGEPAPCSHGRQVRDYLSTFEIASALVSVLESDFEGVVNVGSGEGKSLREIVGHAADVIGRPDLLRFGEIATSANEPAVVVANTERLREEIGWVPEVGLELGIERTVSWWRSNVDTQAWT